MCPHTSLAAHKHKDIICQTTHKMVAFGQITTLYLAKIRPAGHVLAK